MKQVQIKTLVVLVVFSFLLVFLDSKRVLDSVKSPVQTVLAPVQFLFYKTKLELENVFSFLGFWKSGEERIKNLEQRNLELLAVKNRAEVLEKENKQLRQQLGVVTLKAKKQLAVLVLGTGRYLEIDAGSDQGVAVGQTVVYGDNLVGRVAKVSKAIAFVQLPFDSESKIAAKVGTVRGLVGGEFGSGMTISQIAQNEEIRDGDLVFTSGEEGKYEPGVVIGKIGEVKTNESGLFREAKIIPLINFNKLEIVYIVAF